ncbi:MAG: formylglycine-generating enzyme family protein [Opitutaceae bacterium]
MSKVSESVWLCVHETSQKDFAKFVEAGGSPVPKPAFEQSELHPVVNVSWEDALRFCLWLTDHDREQGIIGRDQAYRLPTEAEWMSAAGIEASNSKDYERSRTLVFLWGESWPPPKGSGNFGDLLGVESFAQTSPVGSFVPNGNGFYDLSGNAWEWCADTFEGASDIRVLKGGSWRMYEPSRLALNRRIGNACGLRLPTYGFRVALATDGSK